MKRVYWILLGLATLFVGCQKDRDVEFSTFTFESEKFASSYTSVELTCKVRCDATINELYLQYDTVDDFSTYKEVLLSEDKETKIYTTTISELLDNTTYYVRYLAVNSFSSVMSDKISEFKTLQQAVPTVEVRDVTNVLDTTATVGFVLKFDGGAKVSRLGVCWGKDSDPTIEDKYVECSGDAIDCVLDGDSLSLNISGLEANTVYYVRAYAENVKGISYCESKMFITLALPEVKTYDVTDIQLTSAILNGEAMFNGNDTVTEYGFCWGEEANLEIKGDNSIAVVIVEDSTFTYRLSNLQDETIYYVRAYAKNRVGVVYGDEKKFTTQSTNLAIVVTTEVLDATYTSAKVIGKVENDGGSDITERGFCYSTDKNPTVEDLKVVVDKGLGNFSTILSDLQDGTIYYVKAYAINKKGVSYGETISFTTKAYLLADVTTLNPTNITTTSAVVGGMVLSDGGSEVTERGVCYSTTDTPTIVNNKVVVNEGLGSFTTTLSSLQANTKYYVRAYAKNTKGVSYGEVVAFETKDYLLAEVITSTPKNVSYTSAVLGGVVKSDGGLEVTERGVCYSTTEDPMITDSKIVVNKGLGSFTTTLSDLQEGTRYYVKAYAINNKGVSYGEVVVFETKGYLYPEVETLSLTNIVYTSAIVSGRVKSDGGVEVTERGVCYATTENPTIDNNKIVVDKGLGNFSTTLSNLQEGTKYYVRAYAINKKGVAYGADVMFETLSRLVDLGLSVKWASCNVGAERPDESGHFFAWGETKQKVDYSRSTYKYCQLYNTSNFYGYMCTKYSDYVNWCYNGIFIDNKAVLELEDDAAHVNLGGEWRMPTKTEFNELITKCTCTFTTQNNVNGYKITGPNGRSIFLPSAGHVNYGSPTQVGTGFYWTSVLGDDDVTSCFATSVILRSDMCDLDGSVLRWEGYSVRPVQGPRHYTISVSSNNSSYGTVNSSVNGVYEEGAQITLTATAKAGCRFAEWNDGNTDNPRVFTLAKDVSHTAHFEPEENMTVDCGYVDLGLSVKWATCNIGASKPEDYGEYYAWGEVESKQIYDWTTYKYCNGAENTLTKYCTENRYGNNGFTDGKVVLEPEDDVAHVKLGGTWRMPTREEMRELEECRWIWTIRNGVPGFKVRGPNGNSIFLPAAGYMYQGGKQIGVNSICSYWTNEILSYFPVNTYSINMDSTEAGWDRCGYSQQVRYAGNTVRPVCK